MVGALINQHYPPSDWPAVKILILCDHNHSAMHAPESRIWSRTAITLLPTTQTQIQILSKVIPRLQAVVCVCNRATSVI